MHIAGDHAFILEKEATLCHTYVGTKQQIMISTYLFMSDLPVLCVNR